MASKERSSAGASRPATSKVEADGRTNETPSSSSSMTSGLTPSRAAARCASVVSNWDDQQGRWPVNHWRMAGEPSSATASLRNAEVSREKATSALAAQFVEDAPDRAGGRDRRRERPLDPAGEAHPASSDEAPGADGHRRRSEDGHQLTAVGDAKDLPPTHPPDGGRFSLLQLPNPNRLHVRRL